MSPPASTAPDPLAPEPSVRNDIDTHAGTDIGIDVGATLAKLTIRGPSGATSYEMLPSDEAVRLQSRIDELEPDRIGVTGAGAGRLAENIGRSTIRVEEFEAWRAGARCLLDEREFPHDSRFLLVSLGTGTSVLLMDGENAVRVGGTALGGGTVLGLGAALIGGRSHRELCELASRGRRSEIDLLVSDIYRPGEIALPEGLTAAAFGKLGKTSATPRGGAPREPSPEDLAAAIMGLVAENVGMICVGLSFAVQVERVVYGGTTLRDNPVLTTILEAVTRSAGREASFLPNGEFSGAVGALKLAALEG